MKKIYTRRRAYDFIFKITERKYLYFYNKRTCVCYSIKMREENLSRIIDIHTQKIITSI